MKSTLFNIHVIAGAALLNAATASACPLCHSPTGEKVREGIFNSQFPITLVSMALPFVVIAGVIAVIHHSSPHVPKSSFDLPSRSKASHER
jgi:hypothetical protein